MASTIDVDNPSYWPDPSTIESASEPYIKASILTPEEYVGPVMELCREHRSDSQTMNYLSAGRVEVTSEMPLGEVLFDFYGKLKMITRGYGSFDYVPIEYRKTDIVKVDILVNKEPVDALSYLVHRDKARPRALHYCEQLAEAIPRHQFKIPIQGAIGGDGDRSIDDSALSKRRDRQTLRRRRHTEEKAAGKAEERQSQNEAVWQRQHSARSLCFRSQRGQRLAIASLTLGPVPDRFGLCLLILAVTLHLPPATKFDRFAIRSHLSSQNRCHVDASLAIRRMIRRRVF